MLVVLVIFFFLRSLRATIIPLVTIPVSLIGAFALMYLFGFTINTLTLLALVLAIGLVVDDAIVMLENIFRHVEDGHAAEGGGDRRRARDRLRHHRDDADAGVGLRAARVRAGAHRPAVHRVRAGAGRRRAGLGLRRADALADDVLAAAAAPGAAQLDLQPDRGVHRDADAGYRRALGAGAAPSRLRGRRRVVRRARASACSSSRS